MQNMELAKKTLELLDSAEKLEKENQNSEALEAYLKIVLFLIDNNYMLEQIGDIQKKIEELKKKTELEQNQKSTALQSEEMIDKKKNEFYKQNLFGLTPVKVQEIETKVKEPIFEERPITPINQNETPKTVIEENSEVQISLPSGKTYNSKINDFSGKEDSSDLIKMEGVTQAEADQLQIEGYSLIERAKLKEKQGLIEEAIIDYGRAIKSLKRAGWTENQLAELRQSKERLENDPSRAYSQRFEKKKIMSTQKIDIRKEEFKTEGYIGTKILDDKAVKIKAFETKKHREEEIQNTAFSYIDKAKVFEKDKELLKAVSNYKEAVKLLDSIGWKSQTHKIQIKINNLEKRLKEESTVEVTIEPETQISPEIGLKPKKELSIGDISAKKIEDFEKKRIRESQLQDEAFELLDLAKELESNRKYDDAVSKLEEAREILNQIGWETNTASINSYIDSIRAKEAKEKVKISVSSDSIKPMDIAQIEFDKYRQELKEERKLYNQKQKEQLKKLKSREIREKYLETVKLEGFDLIDQSKELTELLKFDEAIEKLKKATQKFKSIGWTHSDDYINSEIKHIDELKSKYKRGQIRAQLEQAELERKKKWEFEQKEKEEKERKKAVGEIENLSMYVSDRLKQKQEKRFLKAQQEKERLKREAKEFSKSIGALLNLKRELKKDLDKELSEK